ncbi:hypothetical protein LCGC14_3105060 [marine sediment metagenome]|uniref:Uncharacterized protein n=1 Tax=marine sediment metagenome TaxID=412755 RepID=A0A0F8WVJ6_9ZZZZ
MSSDRQERARVRSRIGSLILAFCKRRVGPFHMEDLRRFVEEYSSGKVAPDSPGRVLRHLQQEGVLGYRVVNRKESFYEVLWVGKRPAEQAELFEARAS